MAIFEKLFGKEKTIDLEKLKDQAILSFERCQFDRELYLRCITDISLYQTYLNSALHKQSEIAISLKEEVESLESYLSCYTKARELPFYYKIDMRIADDEAYDLSLFPFMLLPLVKNACTQGYNTLEKFPVRIRLHVQQSKLKLEVSNRVNHHLDNQEQQEEIRWFKSRLQYLYPGNFDLFFNSNTTTFKATLFLELSR